MPDSRGRPSGEPALLFVTTGREGLTAEARRQGPETQTLWQDAKANETIPCCKAYGVTGTIKAPHRIVSPGVV